MKRLQREISKSALSCVYIYIHKCACIFKDIYKCKLIVRRVFDIVDKDKVSDIEPNEIFNIYI